MSNKKTSFLCISILALACMFFAGQAWAQCTGPDPCEGIDCGANGTCVNGSCVCDENWSGALCDTWDDPAVELISGLPMMILGAPGTCETYATGHPLTGDSLACCSAPSSGTAPKCAVGDTPDIACEVVLQFCSDPAGAANGMSGLVDKTWDPDPDPTVTLPGHGTESGPWAYDGAIGMSMTTTSALGSVTLAETNVAVKALDGSTLELTPLLGVSGQDGSSLAGTYILQNDLAVSIPTMPGILDMDIDEGHLLTVTDPDPAGPTAYDTSDVVTTTTYCVGSFCAPVVNPPATVVDTVTGTIAKPGALYELVDPGGVNPTSYVLQPNASATYTRVP